MPRVWEGIEAKKGEWGAQHVAECIRRGMAGEPGWFYAFERGHVVGTPFTGDPELLTYIGLAAAIGGRHVLVMRPPAANDKGGDRVA